MLEEVRGQLKGAKREHAGKRALRRCEASRRWPGSHPAPGRGVGGLPRAQGDYGRELGAAGGPEALRMIFRELGERAGGVDYAAVGIALSRFECRMRQSSDLRRRRFPNRKTNVDSRRDPIPTVGILLYSRCIHTRHLCSDRLESSRIIVLSRWVKNCFARKHSSQAIRLAPPVSPGVSGGGPSSSSYGSSNLA